jgi:pimeloyl-ACP methyl ester carboxylesterase
VRPLLVELSLQINMLSVLLAPAGPTTSAASKALIARAANVKSKGLNSIVGPFIGAGLTRRTRRTQPLVVATVRASILSRSPEGFARTSLALADASTPPAYANIAADTLIVIGGEDKITPRFEGADVVYKGVHKGKIVVLKDVGHWPQLEKVGKTAKLLKDFVLGKTTGSILSRL